MSLLSSREWHMATRLLPAASGCRRTKHEELSRHVRVLRSTSRDAHPKFDRFSVLIGSYAALYTVPALSSLTGDVKQELTFVAGRLARVQRLK